MSMKYLGRLAYQNVVTHRVRLVSCRRSLHSQRAFALFVGIQGALKTSGLDEMFFTYLAVNTDILLPVSSSLFLYVCVLPLDF